MKAFSRKVLPFSLPASFFAENDGAVVRGCLFSYCKYCPISCSKLFFLLENAICGCTGSFNISGRKEKNGCFFAISKDFDRRSGAHGRVRC